MSDIVELYTWCFGDTKKEVINSSWRDQERHDRKDAISAEL